jgi:HPt (histidine-containing phosphotransfer) domain-containing protein
MGQVTIYLDDETEHRLKSAAAAANMPVSRWVATLVKDKTRTQWPDSVQELAGAWHAFPETEELRRAAAADIPREPL